MRNTTIFQPLTMASGALGVNCLRVAERWWSYTFSTSVSDSQVSSNNAWNKDRPKSQTVIYPVELLLSGRNSFGCLSCIYQAFEITLNAVFDYFRQIRRGLKKISISSTKSTFFCNMTFLLFCQLLSLLLRHETKIFIDYWKKKGRVENQPGSLANQL